MSLVESAREIADEVLQEVREDQPGWDWRTMGNKTRGVKIRGKWYLQKAHKGRGGKYSYTYRVHPRPPAHGTAGTRRVAQRKTTRSRSGGVRVKAHSRSGVPVVAYTRSQRLAAYGGPSAYQGSEKDRRRKIKAIRNVYGSVRRFQRKAGIVVDGRVGRQTARAWRKVG